MLRQRVVLRASEHVGLGPVHRGRNPGQSAAAADKNGSASEGHQARSA